MNLSLAHIKMPISWRSSSKIVTEQEASRRLRSTQGAGAKHAGTAAARFKEKKTPSSPSFIHSFIHSSRAALCLSSPSKHHLSCCQNKSMELLQELQCQRCRLHNSSTYMSSLTPIYKHWWWWWGIKTHHGLLDLVVDGHHTCTRGAETHKG